MVVATHGRAGLLPRLVAALEQQADAPAFELVLVDDGSPDGTWGTIGELERTSALVVHAVRMPGQSGPAAARNAGWRATAARKVLFTDDDCVPQPGWLRTLTAALDDADIAQGATVPDPAQRHLLGPFARTMEVTSETGYYQTCNVAYRRAVLERVGGFDDDLRQAGEDIELATRAVRAGARTTFRPDAVVHHDVRPSDLGTHLRATRRWAGIVLAVRKEPELRRVLHQGVFWKRSHAPVIAAAAGLAAVACAGGRWRLVGAAATLPYVRHRLSVEPLPRLGRRRRRLTTLPAAFVADATEVGVLAAASVRYRTLVL